MGSREEICFFPPIINKQILQQTILKLNSNIQSLFQYRANTTASGKETLSSPQNQEREEAMQVADPVSSKESSTRADKPAVKMEVSATTANKGTSQHTATVAGINWKQVELNRTGIIIKKIIYP